MVSAIALLQSEGQYTLRDRFVQALQLQMTSKVPELLNHFLSHTRYFQLTYYAPAYSTAVSGSSERIWNVAIGPCRSEVERLRMPPKPVSN
jgi:hypothetical protein